MDLTVRSLDSTQTATLGSGVRHARLVEPHGEGTANRKSSELSTDRLRLLIMRL
jgi:hypothetical protein